MRKKILLGMMVLFLNLYGTQVNAENIQMVDQADILSMQEESEVQIKIENVENMTGWDVMAVTTEDAEGKSSMRYAEDWYETYSENEDGVICLIDMENRMLYIATFGEAIDYLTDARIERLLDYAYEDASDGAYGFAFLEMIEGMEYMYESGIPRGQYRYDTENEVRERSITSVEIMIACGLALAAGGVSIAVVSGSYKMKWGTYQYPYRENSRLFLEKKKDILESTNVIHRRIPKPSNSSGSSGARSSTHRTSRGTRSGGGGRRF